MTNFQAIDFGLCQIICHKSENRLLELVDFVESHETLDNQAIKRSLACISSEPGVIESLLDSWSSLRVEEAGGSH